MLQAFILLTLLFGVSTIIVSLLNYRLKFLLNSKKEELHAYERNEENLKEVLRTYETKLDILIQMDKINQEALKQKSDLIQELEKSLEVYRAEEAKFKEAKPKVRKPHRKPRVSK